MRAPVPARGPQAEKERKGKEGNGDAGSSRAREPEAAEPESQRGSPRECNRRAFPIYRGPVPSKGRPKRSRDWSRRVDCLYFGWLLGLRAPVPARGPQAEKEREGKEGNGDARSSRAREPERKPKGVQQTGFSYI